MRRSSLPCHLSRSLYNSLPRHFPIPVHGLPMAKRNSLSCPLLHRHPTPRQKINSVGHFRPCLCSCVSTYVPDSRLTVIRTLSIHSPLLPISSSSKSSFCAHWSSCMYAQGKSCLAWARPWVVSSGLQEQNNRIQGNRSSSHEDP